MLGGPSAVADLGVGIAARVGRVRAPGAGHQGLEWRFVLLGSIFGFVALEMLYFLLRPNGLWGFGLFMDAHTLLDATRDWMAGRGFYEAYQFAGLHEIGPREILYPPQILALLVPFTFVPVIVWVVVPLAILVYIVWWWRPGYWGVVAIGLCLCVPTAFGAYLFGNPSIWFVAFVALATRWPAFGPLILIKPTLAPFALVGIRHRAWWVTAGLLAVSTLVTLPMLLDWVTAMRNIGASTSSWTYSLAVVPLMLIPLIARWQGTGRAGARQIPMAAEATGIVQPA